MAVVLCEMEVNIMDDNMNLNKFLMYYGRIVPELDALKEKAENHFGARLNSCAMLTGFGEGNNYDDV